MSRIPWRDRIARAGQLAESIPSAREVMRFYQALLVEQESWCRPGELNGALIEDPAESSREIYARYLGDKDEKMRAAAAEGYARLKNPADLPMLEKAWQDEGKTSPRLSMAFAQVMLGKTEISEFSPLQFLVNTLNSAAYHGEAFPFLVELARDPSVRKSLYTPLLQGTR